MVNLFLPKEIARQVLETGKHGQGSGIAQNLKVGVHNGDVLQEFWVVILSTSSEDDRVDNIGDCALHAIGGVGGAWSLLLQGMSELKYFLLDLVLHDGGAHSHLSQDAMGKLALFSPGVTLGGDNTWLKKKKKKNGILFFFIAEPLPT